MLARAVAYSAAGNFVPISIDKCRLVVTSLVVFWWYDLPLVIGSIRMRSIGARSV
jgi:hypothetical protein